MYSYHLLNIKYSFVREIGVRPSQARLGPARLVSIREKKLGKARLGAGSKIFGSIVARLEIGSKNFGL